LGKKFLVFNLVSRNLKIKYRRSLLGVFWTLVGPLSMAVIYYFVFKVVLRVEMPHYLAFILSGTLPWAFFAQSLGEGMESLVGNQGLLSKVPIPSQVFPFVGVLTNLITLLIALPVVVLAAMASGVDLSWSTVLLPLLYGCLFLIAYALALILAHAFVFLRDLRHLISLVLQVWFYATPVIYDERMVPAKYAWVLVVNPLGGLFTSLHAILVRGAWPEPGTLATVAAWTLGLSALSRVFQLRWSREVVENL
jgi:ABC-type polysaccharide/polyol phosphate export permease